MILTPFGIYGQGGGVGFADLLVEVNSQLIGMVGSGSGGGSFSKSPRAPIDVEAVTAVIINGYRIEPE